MHFHRELATVRIARGVRHADGDFARQAGIRSRTVGTMRLGTGKLVLIVHRPAAVRSLRRAGHGHGNAVHRHHAARHIDVFAGHGHRPAVFAAHGDHAVFAVQLHRERTGAALSMAFTAVFRLLAFVHHDIGVARFRSIHRHHGHVLIALDGDGQRRFRGIAVLIRDGVGEVFRVRLALRHVHALIQLIGVGAVLVQRQRAMLAAHRLTQRAAFNGRHGLVRRGVRAEHVVGEHVFKAFIAAARLRLSFRKRDVIGTGHRPVVPDGQIQSDLGTGTVAVAVRHRQLHADAVERQDIIGIAVVGMNQGTVIFQGKGDIALAVDMHIEDFRITGHADDTAFIIDGQYDRHHLATDEGNKGILRAGIQREFIAAADFTVRTGDDSEVVADIHDILNTCTMKIAFIQLQLRLTSRRHLHGVIFHLDLKLHLA